MSKENILVLFGGSGVESDVSIISAIQVMNGFDKNKYFVINGYLNGNGEFLENEKFSDINYFKREIKGNKFVLRKDKDNLYLVYNNPLKLKKKIDYVVPVFHGKGLEDGTIAGLLETLKVNYTSCGVYTSSVFQNKYCTKLLLNDFKINTINSKYINEVIWKEDKEKILQELDNMSLPLMVKANNLGSSIGVFKVKSKEELYWAINTAFKYDSEVIVEEALCNYREFNQAIVKDKLSSIEEIVGVKDFLTFDNKYYGNDVKKEIGKVSEDIKKRVSEVTLKISKMFNIKGVVRVDYIYDLDKDLLYVNEVNTIPGSFAFYLFEDLCFNELLELAINDSLEKDYLERIKVKDFKTSILKDINGFKVK